MTSKTLGDKPRQGKWTKEEESYVDLLIEEFRCGALPLREGTTLRSFLSKMINCNPKRVSKKYENTNYNGKHKYEPSTIPMSLEEMRRRRERLQDHEQRFLEALKRSEDDLELDEESLQASLDESRRTVATASKERVLAAEMEDQAMEALLKQHKQKTAASCTNRSPIASNGFQGRLAAEIQSRMDLANHLSGSGAPTPAGIRDLSLSNTDNLSLSLPSGFASPPTTAKAQFRGNTSALHSFSPPPVPAKPHFSASDAQTSLEKLASFDFMSSLKQNPGLSKPATMSGLPLHLAELEEDPLGWQVRLQRRTGWTTRAQNLLRDRTSFTQASMLAAEKAEAATFPRLQYLNKPQHQEDVLKRDMPFPGLSDQERRRSFPQQGAIDHLSQLKLATIMTSGERRSSMTDRVFEATKRSSLMSELEMMESLKRGRERQEILDSFRPFKRLR